MALYRILERKRKGFNVEYRAERRGFLGMWFTLTDEDDKLVFYTHDEACAVIREDSAERANRGKSEWKVHSHVQA